MRFSERYGYRKVRELIQIDSIDEYLRNQLWNLLTIFIWGKIQLSFSIPKQYIISENLNSKIFFLCQKIWLNYFKVPLDELSNDWEKTYNKLRNYFFECNWYEVYDFIEFIANNYYFENRNEKEKFIKFCNKILEEEVSAYRLIDDKFVRITNQHEIEEIQQTIDKASNPIRTHIKKALEHLSDKKSPDYRNSIKESISAVESLVKNIIGKKGTLGQLIKKMKDKVDLHPALEKAFQNLYGYTSDEGGIRHALLDLDKVKFEDAKFFLVVCSAFINYVNEKSKKMN